MDQQTIHLPFLTSDQFGTAAGWMANENDRFRILEKLLNQHDLTLDDVPDVYRAEGPLASWCWFVLYHNEIPVEYREDGRPFPIIHYGINFGFSETPVRQWICFLA